jgi:hypothetical protein
MKFFWRFRGAFTCKKRNINKYQNDGRKRNTLEYERDGSKVEKRYKKLGKLTYNIEEDGGVLSWDDIIRNDSFFKQLSIEAKLLWSMYGGDRGGAKSFWISKKATPTCALELFAQRVASFHCSRLSGKNQL